MATFVYRVLRGRGSNYYGACEQVTYCGTYASRESALSAAFELAERELAADKADLFRDLPESYSPRFARKFAQAEQVARDVFKDPEMNADGFYNWGYDTDTGPSGSVRVVKDVVLP